MSSPVKGAVRKPVYMRCKTVYDLVGVPQLLRGEKGVVENPVVLLPVLMIAWMEFDYVPGEYEIRDAKPDYTGKVCVIGTDIHTDKIQQTLHV